MNYGIAIFPAKKLQDLANSYRKRYDPSYALIPPHLTLKDPFEAEEETIQEIIQDLHEISNEFSPITIDTYKVKSFHPSNKKIYIAIQKDEQLIKLFDALNSGNLAPTKTNNFVPHITIGQNLTDQEHSDILGRLSMVDFTHSETVDRFHLLYQLENGSWTTYETIHLGKDC